MWAMNHCAPQVRQVDANGTAGEGSPHPLAGRTMTRGSAARQDGLGNSRHLCGWGPQAETCMSLGRRQRLL